MKFTSLILASVLIGLLVTYSFSIGQDIQNVLLILFLALTIMSRKDANHQFLVLSFLGVFIVGKLILYPLEMYVYGQYSGLINNSLLFGLNIILDFVLLYLIKNRMRLGLVLTKGKKPEVLEKNYSDAPLYGLLLCYISIDLLAFFENIIRNLEHFGVSEAFAQQFWNVTFFYDFYEYFKVTLISLTIAVLYMGVIIRKRQSLSAA